MIQPLTLIGIDPGLRHTGWGVVTLRRNQLAFVGAGRISPEPDLPMATRLRHLADILTGILSRYRPDDSAIEETFVHKNALSALKLGQARGVAMLTLAQADLPVTEYAANRIKQSVTGYGHADKGQIQAMIGFLLPGCGKIAADAADALAVAITHAHHRGDTIAAASIRKRR